MALGHNTQQYLLKDPDHQASGYGGQAAGDPSIWTKCSFTFSGNSEILMRNCPKRSFFLGCRFNSISSMSVPKLHLRWKVVLSTWTLWTAPTVPATPCWWVRCPEHRGQNVNRMACEGSINRNGEWPMVLNKQVSVWYTLILKIIRSYKNHMSILQPPLFSPWCLLAHWISAAQVVSQWWAASSHRRTSVWCPESTESLVSHYSTIIASIIIHEKLVSIIRTIEETIGTNDFLRFLGIGV